jgi:hypothetical protein
MRDAVLSLGECTGICSVRMRRTRSQPCGILTIYRSTASYPVPALVVAVAMEHVDVFRAVLESGDTEIAQMLISAGADVNAVCT